MEVSLQYKDIKSLTIRKRRKYNSNEYNQPKHNEINDAAELVKEEFSVAAVSMVSMFDMFRLVLEDDNYFVQQDDERRVFYVGVTRAKKSLHVIESESTREFKEIF